jgi:sRNA-binding carbon storage regulator CsrA
LRDHNLKIEPFEVKAILSLTASQEVNQHGTVNLTALVPKENEAEYTSLSFKTSWMKISIIDFSGAVEPWFEGVITSLELEVDEIDTIIRVTASSGTWLMDSIPHTRSFQEPSMTYKTVLATYTNDYPDGAFIMRKGKGEEIKLLCMQYRETDWIYTKRLASHFNSVVVPEFTLGGVKYYFGMAKYGSPTVIESRTFKVVRDEKEYQHKKGMGVDISGLDCTYFLLRSRDVYKLGDHIMLNDMPLFVSKIDTRMERAELYHTYYLKTLRGFNVPKVYNECAIGCSFYSKILEVKKDMVKISINDDENKSGCGTRWFPYSTVYSSPDGTGWYAMPEIGDDVRMYVPIEDEAECYVISATHLESSAADERVEPDNKSLMNKYHKEILFTPDSLIITNNNGMSVELLDGEGIKIVSDMDIHLKSEKDINIVSTQEDVSVIAPEEILFEQSEITTQLKENITFNGAQIHLD